MSISFRLVRRLHVRGRSAGAVRRSQGAAMRTLVVTAFVTLDGVMQAPGGPGEDPSGGFAHEGWLVPFFEDSLGAQISEWFTPARDVLLRRGTAISGLFTPAQDFLLGRGTYYLFYASWPKMISDDPVSQGINFRTKHVASGTLSSLDWETAELLKGDVPDAVRALKAQDGGELQVHGSAGPVQTLLAEDLVDELRLILFPVTVGEGKRLFGEGTIPRTWRLTAHSVTASGAVVLAYENAGEVETGYVGPEPD